MRVGTRGSALALAQASRVAARLGADAELVTITTAGDRGAELEDKSRWVSELERALLDGHIDLAVHSAKDVPAELAEGLELVGVPERADPRDAICGATSLAELRAGARIGTSSLRRAAQIRAVRDDLELVALRGNVDTRLRRLAAGEIDALVLALAGLQRLGLEARAGGTLDALVPAAGQGTLVLEARSGTLDAARLDSLDDPRVAACLWAERALTAGLGASCHTPVGAHARYAAGDRLELTAWVGLPDGSSWLEDHRQARDGEEPATLGARVAGRMLAAGAGELLRAAERGPAV
ncbi:MAG: hydroxymethylbilane synthase [Solirubrobacteraceae bacterium]